MSFCSSRSFPPVNYLAREVVALDNTTKLFIRTLTNKRSKIRMLVAGDTSKGDTSFGCQECPDFQCCSSSCKTWRVTLFSRVEGAAIDIRGVIIISIEIILKKQSSFFISLHSITIFLAAQPSAEFAFFFRLCDS